MDLLAPDWHDLPSNVKALCTTRAGGVSRAPYGDGNGGGGLNLGVHVEDDPDAVRENRARLRAMLPSEPAWLTQVHGTQVCDAGLVRAAPQADASVACAPGAVCAILTADCLPVLFSDTAGRTVGAAHAGWRGLAAGVLDNTVTAMRAAGAGDIMAWLGPAIGPQRFEVGEDVLQTFVARDPASHAAFRPLLGQHGKYLADIYQLARQALARAGVVSVAGGGLCTVSDVRRFYSYRRDRITGRMVALIWLES